MTNIVGTILLWEVLSMTFAVMAILYGIYPGKNKTWGELVLAILWLPGWITVLMFFGIAAMIILAWDFLDKPIKQKEDRTYLNPL